MLERALFISVLVLVLTAPSALAGTKIEIDRSFGPRGTVKASFGPTYRGTAFTSVVPQPDGSLLATRLSATVAGTRIRRYTAAGALDPGFAPVQASPVPADVDADGKTVRLFPATPKGSLERLNPDGTPDLTFGVHLYGEQSLSEAAGFEIETIETLSSGKILVGGTLETAGPVDGPRGKRQYVEQVALARFEHDGHLDRSFGNGGVVKLKTEAGIAGVRLAALTPRPGEGVAVALLDEESSEFGEAAVRSGSTIALLAADGRPEASFGTGGAIRVPGAAILSLHVLPGGEVLAAGDLWGSEFTGWLSESDVFLARYDAGGAPDPRFGDGDGNVAIDLAGLDLFGAALWAEDGSIWLGGSATGVERPTCRRYYHFCTETPFVSHLGATGALDAGFGGGGIVRLDRLSYPFGEKAGGRGVQALAARAGGGVLAGGGSGTVAFIAALASGGAPDPGFGSGGLLVEADPRRSKASAHSLAVDSRGRILVAGEATPGIRDTWGQIALFRYLPNGRIDRSFAGGHVWTPGREGKVVVGGDDASFVLSGRGERAVTKVGANGQIDRSFGEEGTVDLEFGPVVRHRGKHFRLALLIHSMAALPGGRLLLAGEAGGGVSQTFILRLRADGTPDPAFGGDGFVPMGFGRHRACSINQIVVERDGRILLAGYVARPEDEGGEEAVSVLRLRADGSRDRRFGHHGMTLLPIGRRSFASALAVGGKGRILLAGKALDRPGHVRELLLRLDPHGRLDRSFGRRGVTSVPVPFDQLGYWTKPRQLLLQRHRILMLRDSRERQLVVYSSDGRRHRAFRVARGAEPRNRLVEAPPGAFQDHELLLGWTVHGRGPSSFKLQRLRVQGLP